MIRLRQKLGIGLSLLLLVSGLLSGCAELSDLAVVGEVFGVDQSIVNLMKSFEDFSNEQEYYIGRTVGARIVNTYPPYDNNAANQYLNLLGQTLALASDRPTTFIGYRFLILDSDEINAFAAPGGLIFVTRGLLRCCPTEDAVAAVLAHEIGHVAGKHGLRAIQQTRITSALTSVAIDQTKKYGSADLAELVGTFEDSISDITTTLIDRGYSRELEYDADNAAVKILKRAGYNPNGLVDMLKAMQTRLKPGGVDFAKTHPAPVDRIAQIQTVIGPYAPVQSPEARQQRFVQALGKI
jgi:beta-barrel assembly-enhancing protease